MAGAAVEYRTYDEVKERLDEIVNAVGSDDLPIKDALSLYEEAVLLGLAASDLIERDMKERRAAGAAEANGAAGALGGVEGAADVVPAAVDGRVFEAADGGVGA